jgi:glutamate-ammonia-ligase adenylyltransferase
MTSVHSNNGPEGHWHSWLEWAGSHGIPVPSEARFTTARERVWDGSEYVALTCARNPEVFATLLADGDLDRTVSDTTLDAALGEMLTGVTEESGLHRALRQFRRRHMLRIIWRDLAGWAELDETLEDLSALADVCIRRALALLTDWTEAALGVPMMVTEDGDKRRQSLIVLGMGKLGARELNLSSDIDLIFAFPSTGEVEGGPRALTNEQFFARLCQRLVKALDTQTEHGFVFRVDTRLRPFGDAGPLAMSFDAMEGYYHSQAREWERYAMIKARVVAGDPGPASELMVMLRPFVYRRYLDFGAIESLRSLKATIDRELKRKGMADNIKLGPGGIREIEFIGQSFQLIRGGRDPELQLRPIQGVLRLLGRKGLLNGDAVSDLIAAYRFLRLTENRIQAWQDRQSHVLPATDASRARLARSMGFSDWETFSDALSGHRRRVQGHFDGIFADPAPRSESDHPLGGLWSRGIDDDQVSTLLMQAGFADPDAARENLARFRDAIARKGLSTRARERLAVVMPQLLRAIHVGDAPDLALPRTLTVLEAIIGRTAYLSLLAENPDALRQLVLLCGKSPWFAERTARQPLLLDELLDPRRLFEPLHRKALEQELDDLLAAVDDQDQEQRMERLRQFARGNQLRVAAADVTGVIPLMVVSDYLTEIAEVATVRSLSIAWQDLARRHGCPAGTNDARPGFIVVGYGKLGGIELGYNSDLDLVFLYDEGAAGSTSGERPVPSEQFYVRLGQRLLHVMTTPTYSGVLYDVDLRLRPDGNKGMIARSLASFSDYQNNNAWTWEHQALVRARPVAGDARLAERFARVRAEALQQARDPDRLRNDVRGMRSKMRDKLDKSDARRFDLKQGRGGIADIEFVVQYAVLRWSAAHPDLTTWTDNIRLLETLRGLALLPGKTADELTAAYKALRAAYHRNALQDTPGLVPNDLLIEERERVVAAWESLIES